MPSKVRKILKKASKALRGKKVVKKPAKKKLVKKTTKQRAVKKAKKKTAKKTVKRKAAKKAAKKAKKKIVKKTTRKKAKKNTTKKKKAKKTTKKKTAKKKKAKKKKKAAKKATKKKTAKKNKAKKKKVAKKAKKRSTKKTAKKATKKKTVKRKAVKKAAKKAVKKTPKKAAVAPVKKVVTKVVVKKPVKKKRIPLKYERPAKLRDLRTKKLVDGEWDPNRSKVKSALVNGLPEGYFSVQHLLYIGAAHGYTINYLHKYPVHLYAVEKSGEMIRHFLPLAENLPNVLTIFGDAANPDGYAHLLPRNVDVLFQDIAQKDQVGIFLANCNRFLSHQGVGLLALKAQNIDSMAEPAAVFAESRQKLEEGGATIVQEINLDAHHKDHRLYVVHLNPIYEW